MNKFLQSLLAFFLFSSALSAETGYIQIKAPSGIMIFLDGNLKGKTSSEQGGLILQDVPAGTREIKALKAGSNPKIYRINVKAGDIAVWDAGVFAPKIMVEESGVTERGGYQPIGSLMIKSVPVDMKVSIQSLGLFYSKTKPDLKFSKIPAGEYLVNFSGFGKSLSSKITIYDKVATEVFVNMLKGEVQNKTEEAFKKHGPYRRFLKDAIMENGSGWNSWIETDRRGWVRKRVTTVPGEEFTLLQRWDGQRYSGHYDDGLRASMTFEKPRSRRSCSRRSWARDYYSNGQKKVEEYKDGKRDGLETWWYKNGKIKFKRITSAGKRLSAEVWKPNGEKCLASNLTQGNVGIMILYNEDGTEENRGSYKDGELVD